MNNLRFKDIASISFKNLFRQKRRTLITAIAIAMGLAAYMLLYSIIIGISESSIRGLIEYEDSIARVVNKDFWKDKAYLPLEKSISNYKELEDAFSKIPSISFSKRIESKAEFIFYKDPYEEDGSVNLILNGIEPERDSKVYRIKNSISSGEYLKEGDNGVLIGSWVAEELGMKVGYPILIRARTKDGAFTLIDSYIRGIVDSEDSVVNSRYAYIDYNTLDNLLYMDGEPTNFSFSFGKSLLTKKMSEIEKSIAQRNDLVALNYKDMAQDFILVSNQDRSYSLILIIVIIIIAAVGVSNTMVMSIFERKKEISVLRAIGTKKGEIRAIFIMESFWIGVIGAVLGLLLGTLINLPLSFFGLNIGAVLKHIKVDMGYRTAGYIRGVWSLYIYLSSLAAGIVIPLVIGFLSSLRLSKINIIEGIRDEE